METKKLTTWTEIVNSILCDPVGLIIGESNKNQLCISNCSTFCLA